MDSMGPVAGLVGNMALRSLTLFEQLTPSDRGDLDRYKKFCMEQLNRFGCQRSLSAGCRPNFYGRMLNLKQMAALAGTRSMRPSTIASKS